MVLFQFKQVTASISYAYIKSPLIKICKFLALAPFGSSGFTLIKTPLQVLLLFSECQALKTALMLKVVIYV